MPAALFLLGKGFGKVGGAGGDAQFIRGAGVRELGKQVFAFINNAGFLIAEMQGDFTARTRDGDGAIVVVKLDGEFVGLEAAFVGELNADNA